MKNLYVYVSDTCPHCHTARQRLNAEGIKYIERNVSIDESAVIEMQKMGFTGVPAFKIDDESFVGFDLEKIKRLVDYTFINCPKCDVKMRIPKGKGHLSISCPSCKHKFELRLKK